MLRNSLRNLRDRQKSGEDEGFTLIELLIVIVVLGILAGIVVFGVAQFRTDADVASCKASLKTVQTAYDSYEAKQPGSTPAIQDLINANYLKTAPDPAYGITLNGAATPTSTLPNCQIP